LCIFTIEKFGRKKLLITGFLIQITSFLLIVIEFYFKFSFIDNEKALEIMMVIFAHGLASGPITWIYFTDILPDIGVALSILIMWTFSALISLIVDLFSWD